MIPLLLADFVSSMLGVLLALMAIFLILLVLVQRGRGGGLAGALGGMGGSSAFGAKAGDVFTRITVGAAAIWIALCMFTDWWGSGYHSRVTGGSANRTRTTTSAPASTDKPAADGAATAPSGDAATAPSGDAAPASSPASTPASAPASAPASTPADAAGGGTEPGAPSNP